MQQDNTISADRIIERSIISWRGIEIEISFERNWLNMTAQDMDTSHLELRTLDDHIVPLPVTETGYRSHFTSAAAIDEAGGPVAYVTAWLDAAACSPCWQQQVAAGRQLSLFG